MKFIERIIYGFISGVKSLFRTILPIGRAAGGAARHPVMRWVLHLVVLGAILFGLYLLNRILELGPKIPGRFRFLAENWLPILFLLMYLLAWLGWWLWTLLTAEEGPSSYPDVDEAWDEAVAALARAGLQVTDLPLFLVVGRPEGPDDVEAGERGRKAEEVLFHHAAQLALAVKQAPAKVRSPLRVYASRDALYVTCAGASLLGRQAAILAGETTAGSSGTTSAEGASYEEPIDKTLRPDSAPEPVRQMVSIVREIAKKGGAANAEERRALRRLERKDKPQMSLLKDRATVSELTGKLRHLCRLIVRDRQPYCPINGLLVLVPFAATDSDEDAQNTAEACVRDLQTVRGALKVNCPQFALLCDLETAPGFREFISRQDPKDRQRRVGQRFPLGTDLRGQPLADALDGSVHWLCNNVLREWVYRLFRVETTAKDDPAAVIEGNGRLYLMLSEMWERANRLSRILTRGLLGSGETSLRFGGTYLAATGQDAAEQAFVAGVFRRLTDSQNYVAWTDEAKAEDARQHRWASIGFGVLGLLGVAVLAVIGLSLFGPRKTS